MRRKLFLLLAALSLVMLTACTKESTESAPAQTFSAEDTQKEDGITEDSEYAEPAGEDNIDAAHEETTAPTEPLTFTMTAISNWPEYRIIRTITEADTITDYNFYEDKFVRLSEDYIGLYKAGTSNGYVFPFIMSHKTDLTSDGMEYDAHEYGFVDETGCIVSDYGYDTVVRSGSYWIANKGADSYHISLDGRHVIKTHIYNEFYTPGIVVKEYNDQFYEISYVKSDNSLTSTVKETVYDLDGNIVLEKAIDMGPVLGKDSIPVEGYENFSVAATDLLDGKYLKVINYDASAAKEQDSLTSSIVDLDSMTVIMQEYYSIKMFENHTFAAKKFENGRDILYNCLGQPVNEDTFYYIEYLDYDYYLVKDGENTATRIVKLEDGEFKRIKTLEAGSYYESDGFVATKNEENYGSQTYYLFDGTKVDASTDERVRLYENAMSQDDIWYKAATEDGLRSKGAMTGTEEFLDEASLASLAKEYYGFDGVSLMKENETSYYMAVVDMSENSILLAIPEMTARDGNYKRTVQNGIVCYENKLINLKTRELIFKYTASEE